MGIKMRAYNHKKNWGGEKYKHKGTKGTIGIQVTLSVFIPKELFSSLKHSIIR